MQMYCINSISQCGRIAKPEEVRVESGTHGGLVAPFEIDDYTRWRLLEGLDDIGLTLRHEDLVTDFESRRPGHKPVTTPA